MLSDTRLGAWVHGGSVTGHYHLELDLVSSVDISYQNLPRTYHKYTNSWDLGRKRVAVKIPSALPLKPAIQLPSKNATNSYVSQGHGSSLRFLDQILRGGMGSSGNPRIGTDEHPRERTEEIRKTHLTP